MSTGRLGLGLVGNGTTYEWENVLVLGAKLQRQFICGVLVVIVREVRRRRKGHT